MTSFLIFSKSPSNQSIDSIFQSITYVTLYESSQESFRNLALFRGLFFGRLLVELAKSRFDPPEMDIHSTNTDAQ